MSDTNHSEVVYKHLLHLEEHWTAQLQNQQQRIASVLTVNGLLLSFLGFGGLNSALSTWEEEPTVLFFFALGLLAVALGFGLGALWPKIDLASNEESDWAKLLRIGRPPGNAAKTKKRSEARKWLDAAEVQELAGQPGDMYEGLAELVSANLKTGEHKTAIEFRRVLMRWQIRFSAAGLITLTIAIGLQVASSI